MCGHGEILQGWRLSKVFGIFLFLVALRPNHYCAMEHCDKKSKTKELFIFFILVCALDRCLRNSYRNQKKSSGSVRDKKYVLLNKIM